MEDWLKDKFPMIMVAGSPHAIGKEGALALAKEGSKVVMNNVSRDPFFGERNCL